MKKILSIGLLGCVFFSISITDCFAELGDVNGSGKADLSDLILILKVLSDSQMSQTLSLAADVNGDNKIGLQEAAYLSDMISATDKRHDHEDAQDYVWDSSEVTYIVLNGTSITVNGSGATAEGSKVTITSAGTYSIGGALTDGQIIVNTEDKEVVRLILNGADIRNSAGAPVYVISAEKVVIVLADHTENHLADGTSYIFENADEDEPNAAIFSKADLTVYGNGSLTVYGNFNDGIASKDGLIIKSGTVTVTSADDGIRGKDYLIVKGGSVTVNAKGDGLKSDNEEDAEKGYISVEKGLVNITSGGDAFDAQTDVMISDGEMTLSSGGGSNSYVDENSSAKGIKAAVSVTVEGGTFAINSADDAIHSNDSLIINGGTFDISSGDDGMHADSALQVNGGDIRIAKSYEGIESSLITINKGNIHIISGDDGVNVAGGNDSSGGIPGMPGRPGPGGDGFTPSGNYWLYINGGYIAVDAVGDGIDVNGSIEMTGGEVIVSGPTANMNSALDYDGSFKISGGFLAAAGSSGMAQAPGASSAQNSLLLNFTAAQQSGSLIHIRTGDGKGILTFSPSKRYQSIAFSSAELVTGSAYNVYCGGSSTGTLADGLYRDGTYTPGTEYSGFTVSGIVTKIGSNFR